MRIYKQHERRKSIYFLNLFYDLQLSINRHQLGQNTIQNHRSEQQDALNRKYLSTIVTNKRNNFNIMSRACKPSN